MRWIVDGMNVIGSSPDGWWRDRRRAMTDLVERLDRWAGALPDGDDVAVIFEQKPLPPIASRLVTVGFAPCAARDSADDEIVRLVSDGTGQHEITVVTSDSRLAVRVGVLGARIQSAGAFRRMINR